MLSTREEILYQFLLVVGAVSLVLLVVMENF